HDVGDAEPEEAGPDLGRLQHHVDLGVELLDDRHRRAGWREDALPDVGMKSDLRIATLDHGRHVRQFLHALLAGNGQGPQLAFADQPHEVGRRADIHLDATAEDIDAHLLAAGVWNGDDVDAGDLVEIFADDLRHGGEADAEVELSGVGLR